MISATLSLATAAAMVVVADTSIFSVLNHGRPAGDMMVIEEADSVVVRYQHIDRNRGQWLEARYWIGADGAIRAAESRPMDRAGALGEPDERFEIVGDSVRWLHRGVDIRPGGSTRARPAEARTAPFDPETFYRLERGTSFQNALLARFLLRRPQQRASVIPGGEARLGIAADTVVTTHDGPERVRLALIEGLGPAPAGVWLDANDELFASDVAWFLTVRPAAEPALPTLRALEAAHREAQAARLARRLERPISGALVIRNGDVFDSERATLLPRTSIVIEGERIVALGPAAEIATPPGATVIDATGRTVLPGLWDMHGHFQMTSQTSGSIMQLATGITTVRDLASDIDVAVSHRDRANAGSIVSPRVILAGFMEGPGAWAGPSEVIVATEAEARGWVARYDSLGYRQIKLYNLIHPDLVPVIADEAQRRGMRLSGHIPRGLSVAAAIQLGFDEINHAAFLFSTFFPDSLFAPEMRAYSAVAATVAPRFDVDSPEMTALIELLRQHGTVIDGTFNLWQGAGTLTGNGSPASAAYGRLLRRLYDAGVTLVPGTDNFAGTTYVTELQLYEHAGIPPHRVLQLATIVPARVMGDGNEYGSIARGKVADIIIVAGRPTERIADLRNVEHVIRAGRVYRADELREAIGLRTRTARTERNR
ncbi:MAG: amidohydrolase family protein [Longimicrobiales bacterium]